MSTVRINELARELEVKSKAILDALTAVGVTEKKTHSSSIEEHEAERVRAYVLKGRGAASGVPRHEAEVKPKIDWSQVHKPGDVARAILEQKQHEAHPAPPRPAPPAPAPAHAVAAKPVIAAAPAPSVARPDVPAAPAAPAKTPAEAAPAPRRIVPQPRQAPNVVVAPPPAQPRPGTPAAPPQTPAIAAKPPVGPVVAKP
ncbi:MAG: translation initiation factor IF-2 N-terminal domain-containing protein, partial [Acidobacteriaceae bacterium]